MTLEHPQVEFMERAIALAKDGSDAGDYQLGAVVIDRYGAAIGEAHTSLKTSVDPTAHAEVLAIRRAADKVNARMF